MSESNFLDDLLEKAEQKDEMRTEAYFDLVLLQIKSLQEQIGINFKEAEKEVQHINTWVLQRNSILDERCKFLELKLEAFIRVKKLKTIELPNGTLKMHRKPPKIEIENLELFLKHARPEVLTIIPEQVKPDLNKLKAFIKTKPVPEGVIVIEGKEEFSYKLRTEEENGKEETGSEIKSASNLRAVI